MKTTITLIILMLLIPISSAVDIVPSSSKAPISVSSSSSKAVGSSSGGSQFLTEYGWDGEKCIKKDIIGHPYQTRIGSIFKLGSKEYKTRLLFPNVPAKKDHIWAIRIINGENGVAWNINTKKVVEEPICDTSRVDIKPLKIGWENIPMSRDIPE